MHTQKVHVASAACRQCKYGGCELSFFGVPQADARPGKGLLWRADADLHPHHRRDARLAAQPDIHVQLTQRDLQQ